MENTTSSNLAEISISYTPVQRTADRQKIRCSQDAERILRAVFPSVSHREYMYLVCLDRSNHCLGYFQVSAGGISGTVSDVRLIFQAAIKANASGIIIAHNHPSGNQEPSESDMKLTRKVKEGGTLLDIPLLDHLILTDSGYKSFADDNIL